ncbi:MAG TPA: hypothetical protein VF762_09135 [Blastocatellia bacterium]|jgi:hypothetical protein
MKKRFHTRLLLCAAALLIPATVLAQAPAAPQAGASPLPSLPECDAIMYINARRIINEALPRILPAAQYGKVKAGLEDMKKKTGIDINGLESGVLALRFGKPITSPPDFVFVVRGAFNADSLLSLARIGMEGKLREEKYGSKSINVFKLSEVMGQANAKSLPIGTNDLAASALDGGTLVLGTLPYVKATIDAEAGQRRASPELVALAMRDAGALLSMAIIISPGLLNGALPPQAAGNEEITRIISGIENFYLSVGMNATDFPLAASVRTASAEQAHTLSGILEMGLHAVSSQITDKNAQSMIDTLKVTTEGNEVQAKIAIPQETVATLIRRAGEQKPNVKANTPPKEMPARKPQRKKP